MTITRNTSEVAQELARIEKANRGVLTPEVVLKNAKSERSPIHNHFTWDDTTAAHHYRLHQASQLIRSVKVRVDEPGREPVSVRAYVSVKEQTDEHESDSVYVPFECAMVREDFKAQVLANAYAELAAFRRKYSTLKELSGVLTAIEKLEQARAAA